MASLFTGPDSLRVKSERRRIVLTLIFLAPALGIVAAVTHNSFSPRNLVLLLVGAMLYISLSRGQLLGGGVRIGPGQFEHVYDIVLECAQLVGVPMPHVFVREDPFVPIVAVGTGDPYAIVISSQYVESFSDDELRFLVGRELGHIAAGHAKITSLLSVNGRENPFIAAIFGAWLRITEYSADRVGLLCCGSLTTAVSAIAVATFHHAGRKIDLHAFAEQRREIDAESSLRIGEWIGATPYATNRIARLGVFARDPLYQRWSAWFLERRSAPTPDAAPLAADDPRRYAGFWRRAAAFVIDLIVIANITPSQSDDEDPTAALTSSAEANHTTVTHVHGVTITTNVAPGATPIPLPSEVPAEARHISDAMTTIFSPMHVKLALTSGLDFLILFGYTLVLVGLVGQTLGMIIMDMRVVGVGRNRVSLRATIWRYACFWFSFVIVVGVFGIFRRIQPFELWSRTRLVSGSGSRN